MGERRHEAPLLFSHPRKEAVLTQSQSRFARRYSGLVALGAVLIAPALAAQSDEVRQHFDNWNTRNGGHWRLFADDQSAFARCLWGGSTPSTVKPASDAEFFALARAALNATQAIHGVDSSTLVDDGVLLLPLALAGSTDKVRVRLRQVLGGLEVEQSFVNLLFSRSGALLSIDTQALARARDLPIEGALLDMERAYALSSAEFERVTGGAPSWIGAEREFVKPVVRGGERVGVRAWAVGAHSERDGALHAAFEFHLDASSGEVLERRSLVHDFDVSGTVRTLATPGAQPDLPTNLPTSQELPYVEVTSAAGNVVTDVNGNFNILGASAPLQVTVKYLGPWCNSRHNDGTNYTFTTTLNAPSGNQVLLNASPVNTTTAQANVHLWVSRVRDWIKGINPADTAPDFQVRSNANLAGACNAYYSVSPPPPSINFFTAGTIPGLSCANMAFSAVVAHELGHWLNDRYSSGNGSDGMGEGLADTYAMYLLDTPIVGEDYCGTGCFVRTGLNTRQFCGDGNPGCHGQVHRDGEVLMGALWKVRARLKSTLGASAGALTADALFSSWLNAYDDTHITTLVEVHYLTLDDDDGNLSNGTPNYLDIDGAFRDQGFPGVQASLCGNMVSYCTSSTTTGGCVPTMNFTGMPSVTANSGFVLSVSSVDGQRTGLIFYGINGRVAFPWSTGSTSWFCVKSPVQRTFVHNSGGSPGACNGGLSVDWNHFRATYPGALGNSMAPYAKVQTQAWFRDPAAVKTTNLSNAMEFTVCP